MAGRSINFYEGKTIFFSCCPVWDGHLLIYTLPYLPLFFWLIGTDISLFFLGGGSEGRGSVLINISSITFFKLGYIKCPVFFVFVFIIICVNMNVLTEFWFKLWPCNNKTFFYKVFLTSKNCMREVRFLADCGVL